MLHPDFTPINGVSPNYLTAGDRMPAPSPQTPTPPSEDSLQDRLAVAAQVASQAVLDRAERRRRGRALLRRLRQDLDAMAPWERPGPGAPITAFVGIGGLDQLLDYAQAVADAREAG